MASGGGSSSSSSSTSSAPAPPLVLRPVVAPPPSRVAADGMPTWLLFGFGSLVWRPEAGLRRVGVGRVRGVARRLWLASIDHRGTAAAPGRVVTLVPTSAALSDAVCDIDGDGGGVVGVVYECDAATMERLAIREAGGYTALPVSVELVDEGGGGGDGLVGARRVAAWTFAADSTSPFWVGPPVVWAAEALRSVSPSSAAPASVAGATVAVVVGIDDDAPAATCGGGGGRAIAPSSSLSFSDVGDAGGAATGSGAGAGAGAAAAAASVGEAPWAVRPIAAVVASASGPSGTNMEYVCHLRDALRSLGAWARDAYIEAVCAEAEALMSGGGDCGGAGGAA